MRKKICVDRNTKHDENFLSSCWKFAYVWAYLAVLCLWILTFFSLNFLKSCKLVVIAISCRIMFRFAFFASFKQNLIRNILRFRFCLPANEHIDENWNIWKINKKIIRHQTLISKIVVVTVITIVIYYIYIIMNFSFLTWLKHSHNYFFRIYMIKVLFIHLD